MTATSVKNELRRFAANRTIFIALALLFGCAYTFIEMAGEVREGETTQFDNWILQALRSPTDPSVPLGPGWLLPTFQDISALGGVSVLLLFTLAISGFFLLTKKGKLLLFFLCSIGGGTLLMVALKLVFARPRPSVVPHLVHATMESFPSGHSMVSAIFFLTIGALLAQSTSKFILRVYYITVACLIALLIGVSRIYLGVHYPTDVLAGWCAGIAWAAASYVIAEWLQKTGAVEEGTNGE